MTKDKFDKFHIYLKEDFFDKGDILRFSNNECKVIKTYRGNWFIRLLIRLGFDLKINSKEIIIYKVKLLK